MPEVRTRRSAEELERAILTATLELVGERGYAALPVDAVAERAGAARSVLYRRWPDKPHLVAAALEHAKAGLVPEERTGELKEDLRAVIHNVADLLAGPLGAACVAIYSDRGALPELQEAAERAGFGPRRRAVERVLDRAVADGELDPAVLTSEAVHASTACLLFHQIEGDHLDHALADAILEDVVWPSMARFRR